MKHTLLNWQDFTWLGYKPTTFYLTLKVLIRGNIMDYEPETNFEYEDEEEQEQEEKEQERKAGR